MFFVGSSGLRKIPGIGLFPKRSQLQQAGEMGSVVSEVHKLPVANCLLSEKYDW